MISGFLIAQRLAGTAAKLPCARVTKHVLAIFAGTFGLISAQAAHELHPDFTPIVTGLDYAHIQMTNWNSSDPWSIHIARLDRTQKNLRVAEHLSQGEIFGTAPVSVIAQSFPKDRGEALLAINAGFCIRTANPYNGAPRGIGKDAHDAMVIVDGEVVGAPSKYNFWINEDGSMHFGDIKSQFQAKFSNGKTLPIGLNRECESGDVVLFTRILGKSTRATNHLELVLESPSHASLSWHVGESYVMQVKAVNRAGNTQLSNNVCVLSFGEQRTASGSPLHLGDKVTIELSTSPSLQKVVTACHAVFPVVQNGKPVEKFDAGAVMQHRNPRTAIGFNDRYFFMVVVDGRQKQLSMGMTARDLAEFMKSLGCEEAMNLDGGGSSTFWMQGKTRNSVPGGKERTRGDALIVVRQPTSKVAVIGNRAAR
jgi:exopolysaccharide biosynthesis protein